MNDMPTPTELTNRSLNTARRDVEADPGRAYGNPLADPELGMSQNWHKHMVPENAVAFIKNAATIEEGIARVAETGIQDMYDRNPGMETLSAEAVIGAYKTIAARFGMGAAGEAWFETVLEGRGETVLPQEPGDEDAGIDVRTDEATYQIKTADKKRYDWSAKEADHLIWVKPGEGWTELEG